MSNRNLRRFLSDTPEGVKKTSYDGIWYRSELEARHAVFMDLLGVRYQYESKTFHFEGNVQYTPDFWLPDLHYWLEIKPSIDLRDEAKGKLRQLRLMQANEVFLIEGMFRSAISIYRVSGDGNRLVPHSRWCICPLCKNPYIDPVRRCQCNIAQATGDQVAISDAALHMAIVRAREEKWFQKAKRILTPPA